MPACSVRWCVALATSGHACPIHTRHPVLHPDETAAAWRKRLDEDQRRRIREAALAAFNAERDAKRTGATR